MTAKAISGEEVLRASILAGANKVARAKLKTAATSAGINPDILDGAEWDVPLSEDMLKKALNVRKIDPAMRAKLHQHNFKIYQRIARAALERADEGNTAALLMLLKNLDPRMWHESYKQADAQIYAAEQQQEMQARSISQHDPWALLPADRLMIIQGVTARMDAGKTLEGSCVEVKVDDV